MRLVMVAAPAEAAERARRWCCEGELGPKLAADRFVDGAAVRILAREARHYGFHHLAHVFDGGGAGLGNSVGNRGIDVRRRSRRREVFFESRDLRRFLVYEIRAAGFGELF